ncbi:MAG: hypothetical protein KDJ37_17370 [Hyphomicrobiaceae bacterium]|nr:hypothetical protein [Hyphomicrobiaceae bacterium]
MKFNLASMVFGLALAATALPAAAGDYDYDYGGSIKDYGSAGVPVPAPVPLPMYEADWYLRFDAGFAFGMSGDVSVTGFALPHNDLDDVSGTASFSAGFGRYLTPSIRWDVNIDLRNGRGITEFDTPITTTTSHTGPIVTIDIGGGATVSMQSVDIRNYDGDYRQRGRVESDTVFFNMYYDIDTGTRFKPYLGGGVGAVRHYLKSAASGQMTCTDVTRHIPFDPISGLGPFDTLGLNCPDDAEPITDTYTTSATGYGLAANVMAGISAEVHPGIIIDAGYRMTWMSGTVALTATTPFGPSFIDIGDRIDHELRTGLRFNLN